LLDCQYRNERERRYYERPERAAYRHSSGIYEPLTTLGG
jgi:hypothetical protein